MVSPIPWLDCAAAEVLCRPGHENRCAVRIHKVTIRLPLRNIEAHASTFAKTLKHIRCNPDAAPRLTSGGYEEQKWCFYSNQQIVHRGWEILIPYEDKVDVITPTNILFIEGAKFDP